MVVDGTVFVATIGATVAAATGVTVLKMDFCGAQIMQNLSHSVNDYSLFLKPDIKKQKPVSWCAEVEAFDLQLLDVTAV